MIRAVVLLGLTLVGLAGCYRPAPPPPLAETLAISIAGNQARLPRVQGYLMAAVGRVVEERLGWRTAPQGTARLDLAIQEEQIKSEADDNRGLPVSWSIRVRGTAMLTTRQGTRLGTFAGTGNVTGLAGEPEALQAAAQAAASDLAGWLEASAREIGMPAPEPRTEPAKAP